MIVFMSYPLYMDVHQIHKTLTNNALILHVLQAHPVSTVKSYTQELWIVPHILVDTLKDNL
jgi:hypothetical protein